MYLPVRTRTVPPDGSKDQRSFLVPHIHAIEWCSIFGPHRSTKRYMTGLLASFRCKLEQLVVDWLARFTARHAPRILGCLVLRRVQAAAERNRYAFCCFFVACVCNCVVAGEGPAMHHAVQGNPEARQSLVRFPFAASWGRIDDAAIIWGVNMYSVFAGALLPRQRVGQESCGRVNKAGLVMPLTATSILLRFPALMRCVIRIKVWFGACRVRRANGVICLSHVKLGLFVSAQEIARYGDDGTWPRD